MSNETKQKSHSRSIIPVRLRHNVLVFLPRTLTIIWNCNRLKPLMPELEARQRIDDQLAAAGWIVRSVKFVKSQKGGYIIVDAPSTTI